MKKIYLASILAVLSTSVFSQGIMPLPDQQPIDTDQYVYCQLNVQENAPDFVSHTFDLATWDFTKGQSEDFKILVGYSGQLIEGNVHFEKVDQNVLIAPTLNLMAKNLSVSKFREIHSSSSVVDLVAMNPFNLMTEVSGVEAISAVALECQLQTPMQHVGAILQSQFEKTAVLQEQLNTKIIKSLDDGERGSIKGQNVGDPGPSSSQGDLSFGF